MPAQPDKPASAQPVRSAGALAYTWRRLRATTGQHLLVVGALCLGIALLLTAMDARGFGANLVYSACIGVICTALVNISRLVVAWLSDHVRRSRGLPLLDTISGWRGAIVGSLVAVALGPTLGMGLGDLLTGNQSASLLQWSSPATRIALVLGLMGTAISLAIISSLERLGEARAQAEAAQRQAAETQLRLLQSQLEPHMLFNTLANLRVLIGLQPQQAQDMLDHLMAYLRATLSASRAATHPLATEFDRVADYLALMAVRMGPRLQVRLDLPDALRQVPVPPLLLQPLVENAIKHGLEPQVAGGLVHVQALQQGAELHLVVRDTGRGLQPPPPGASDSSFGMAQVQERLATLFGAAARVTLQGQAQAQAQGLVAAAGPATAAPATGVVVTIVLPMPASNPAKPTI